MPNKNLPRPIFASLEELKNNNKAPQHVIETKDYQVGRMFLMAYDGSPATFNAYRREIERLCHWSWLIEKKSILELKRQDLEDYLFFCQSPPLEWIGLKKTPRFIQVEGVQRANPEWRPFIATVSKASHRKGIRPKREDYQLSQSALRDIFSILSSFYNFLIQEEVTEINPIANIRQKSKFLKKHQGKQRIRRLSEQQWQYVIETAENLANLEPIKHERTLFIMSALFALYLRISELVADERWSPTMNDFWQDHDTHWWFTTVGKGNKERQIAVSHAMLKALERWRRHLGLSSLPTAADHSPLLPKLRGKGGISSTTYVREIVQYCFDQASFNLRKDGLSTEAENLHEATVHWLRHTGISEDVKTRPREHVRDDAGHSSSAITDKYIDIELKERHASNLQQPIKQKN